MILSAKTLRERYRGAVTPFIERAEQNGMTYGLSLAGYDVRCKLKVPFLSLLPGKSIIVETLERFSMPTGVVGIVHPKSAWLRRMVSVDPGVLEPGWRGHLLVVLHNHSEHLHHVQDGDPVAQVVFHLLDQDSGECYSGKHQDQPHA